jgi:hypothetical protein
MALYLLGALLSLIGLGCGVACTVGVVRAARIALFGVEARGTVVGHVPDDDGHTLLVAFTVDGHERRFESNVVVAAADHPVGSACSVRYVPSAPERASLSAFSERWASPIATGVAALTFGAMGCGLLVALVWY